MAVNNVDAAYQAVIGHGYTVFREMKAENYKSKEDDMTQKEFFGAKP